MIDSQDQFERTILDTVARPDFIIAHCNFSSESIFANYAAKRR